MEMLRDKPEIDLVYRYAEAWNRLDLDEFAPHLAEDVAYESQNVFDVLRGREVVEDYLRQKMETVRRSPDAEVRAEIGLCGDQRGWTVRVATAGENRACVLLEQGSSSEPVALVLLSVEKDEVSRIDICTVAPHPSSAHRTGIYPGATTAA